jgi:hypothetical protein
MKLAVMQPYFFPYIGYFQLVKEADTFVFFNDVNFIKKGWINKNNLLQHNKPLAFTIPLQKVSQNKHINEVEISDFAGWRKDFIKTLEFNYKKATHFETTSALIKQILFKKEYTQISDLASESVIGVSKYLGLKTNFTYSSDLSYKGENGQDKIINICSLLHATSYTNPKNGAHMYDESVFKSSGIDLFFLEAENIQYPQLVKNEFIPWLSIIDVLMFNSKEEVLALLDKRKICTIAELL